MSDLQALVQKPDNLEKRQAIAAAMFPDLKWEDEVTAYMPCPGQNKHTTPTERNHCWVKIDGVPTIYCHHNSCTEEVKAANRRLRTGIQSSAPDTVTKEQKAMMMAVEVRARKEEEIKVRTRRFLPTLLESYVWSYDQIVADSPISIPPDDWEGMLRSFLGMFEDEDIVWIGEVSDTGNPRHAAHFQSKATWLNGVTREGPYTCPSSFVAGSNSRSKDNVANQRYLVVESDSLTKDEVGAVFRWLDQTVGLPLRAVVDTAGKSLHGWFEYPPLGVLAELKIILPLMGCDPKMFGASQPCRLPGGLRDGRIQRLIYSKNRGLSSPVRVPSESLPSPQEHLNESSHGYFPENSKGVGEEQTVENCQPRSCLLPSTLATLGGDLPIIQLPGNSVAICESARKLFSLIAPQHKIFNRGGGICELVRRDAGRLALEVIPPSAFRSRVEGYARLVAERVGKDGKAVLKPTVMPEETSRALLDTAEAREFLPSITCVVNCPVLRVAGMKVRTLGRGYDPETGLLISGGQMPPEVPIKEAVVALEKILAEFDFPSEGDRSRALASLLTPAFKLGGFISGKVPADVAEADQSQAGKTYRQRVIAAVYNEILAPVVRRAGGVGSIDESFAQQLVSGKPFIQIDNLRDKFDSQYIESFMTATDAFPARLPHAREIMVKPDWFFVFLTSNGVNTTRDFANRSSIIRIRKREGFQYSQYPEGDLFAHVQKHQNYYLGCVFAILREWIRTGSKRTTETRHDFREWAQVTDWVVQNVFKAAPVMDGHVDTQARISNPALTLLRNLALHVAEESRLGEALSASQLYDICETHGVEIPGLKTHDGEAARKRIGVLFSGIFKVSASVILDDFQVNRSESRAQRPDGEGYRAQKNYTFRRGQMSPTLPPRQPGCDFARSVVRGV